MGLLGNLFKKAGSSVAGTGADTNTISSIFELINHQQVGGLESLVGKMTSGGLGNIVNSWVGTGKNETVNPGQIHEVLGSEVVGQVASKLGISQEAASEKIATFLPTIIDKLTPNGKIEATSQTMNVKDILSNFLNR